MVVMTPFSKIRLDLKRIRGGKIVGLDLDSFLSTSRYLCLSILLGSCLSHATCLL